MTWPLIDFLLKEEDFAHVIRTHEITVQVARTPGLIKLLNDLHGSHSLRQDMVRDPQAILKERGMTVPRNGRVTFRHFKNGGWELSVTITEAGYTFINGFSTEAGFFTTHHPEFA